MEKQHHGHASRDSAIHPRPEERGFPRSLMNNQLVTVEVMVRPGAGGSQAIWAAYKIPGSQQIVTVWGTLKTPVGSSTPSAPGQAVPSVVFSNKKEVNGKICADLYAKKRRKYSSMGDYELNLSTLQADLQRPGAEQFQPPSKPPEASRTLPKDVSHPEARGGGSVPVNWFF